MHILHILTFYAFFFMFYAYFMHIFPIFPKNMQNLLFSFKFSIFIRKFCNIFGKDELEYTE